MTRTTVAVLAGAALILGWASAVAAAGPFDELTSTESGYHTWDSDQINIEGLSQTGAGVYVAVLDTGLVPNWLDYFPEERVDTALGTGFDQSVTFRTNNDPCGLETEVGQLHQTTWVGSTGSTHGTHVASTILGYFYRSNFDALAGFPLPPIVVRGIAPNVTVIPVKVLADYQVPALPNCDDPGPLPAQNAVFGTNEMVAAGIDYVTGLKEGPLAGSPVVINMSLGGPEPSQVIEDAIDRAIEADVIIVASAGNEGEVGMGWPGAYPQVISAGSNGWTREWLKPANGPFYRMWWLKYPNPPLLSGSGDVPDPTNKSFLYVSDFSSRELPGQELDVLAPGSWVRGPFPGDPGFAHLPWWSQGIADLISINPGNFFYVGGTSMSSPHVASVAALILEKNGGLTQAQVESILRSSAFDMPSKGSRTVFGRNPDGFRTISWDTKCGTLNCDPVGDGVLNAAAAIAATP